MSTASHLPENVDLDRLRFDPQEGAIVRDPPGSGYGYWSGAAKVFFDTRSGRFVLFYRQRSPLERARGYRCAIALSEDGIAFSDCWSASKEELAANSIEVGHCVRDSSGEWRLYVSYEVAGLPYWRIDVIRGPAIEGLSAQSRRTVLMPFDYGLRWLKDPIVYLRDGRYYVYVAGPSRSGPSGEGATLKARPGDATLLAVSEDGLYFPQLEYVFEAPGTDTWDGRRARINSLVPLEGGYLAIYDGGRTSYDNYEEWCGLAWSADGLSFERLPLEAPWVRSPHGCVRYVYGLRVGNEVFFYYEFTREDLSHDLRVSRVSL